MGSEREFRAFAHPGRCGGLCGKGRRCWRFVAPSLAAENGDPVGTGGESGIRTVGAELKCATHFVVRTVHPEAS